MLKLIASLILLVAITRFSNIYFRLTYDFDELPSSKNILYEKGPEDLVEYTHENLADVVAGGFDSFS